MDDVSYTPTVSCAASSPSQKSQPLVMEHVRFSCFLLLLVSGGGEKCGRGRDD